MSTCYLCNTTLSKSNKSFEHIIPNCIGGFEGSYDLLCKNCNNKLGLEIEGDFARSLNPISALLQIKRHRNKIPHIKNLTDEAGDLYHLENGRNPIKVKPIITRHDDHYEISANNWKQIYNIISKIKAKEPSLDTENLEQKFTTSKKRLKKPLHFNLSIGGIPFFRTIAKIAVNAYLFYGGDRKYISNAVQYISGAQVEASGLIHYHIEQEPAMHLDPTEICHCVYVKGSAEDKMLYVYIELFNGPSFIVKLSNNYQEQSFEKTYCIDVLEGKKIHKNVTLKYPEKASPEGYKPHDPVFFPIMQARMSRMMKIADIRQRQIVFKEEFAELWKECQQNYNGDATHNKRQSDLFLAKVNNLLIDLLNNDENGIA